MSLLKCEIHGYTAHCPECLALSTPPEIPDNSPALSPAKEWYLRGFGNGALKYANGPLSGDDVGENAERSWIEWNKEDGEAAAAPPEVPALGPQSNVGTPSNGEPCDPAPHAYWCGSILDGKPCTCKLPRPVTPQASLTERRLSGFSRASPIEFSMAGCSDCSDCRDCMANPPWGCSVHRVRSEASPTDAEALSRDAEVTLEKILSVQPQAGSEGVMEKIAQAIQTHCNGDAGLDLPKKDFYPLAGKVLAALSQPSHSLGRVHSMAVQARVRGESLNPQFVLDEIEGKAQPSPSDRARDDRFTKFLQDVEEWEEDESRGPGDAFDLLMQVLQIIRPEPNPPGESGQKGI